MNFIEIITGRFIFNYIGGSLRYGVGTIGSIIFKKPKYSFREYLYGPKEKKYYDEMSHQFNNRIIGIVVTVLILVALVRLNWIS